MLTVSHIMMQRGVLMSILCYFYAPEDVWLRNKRA